MAKNLQWKILVMPKIRAPEILLLAAYLLQGLDARASDADWVSEFQQALAGGQVILDARYRLETVDQDDLGLKNATASTLRTRLGYLSGNFKGFEFYVEGEDVSPIGEENYNSTVNGNTDYSNVVDPDGTEINQYFLRFKGLRGTTLTAGRQRFVLDNHRFIGDVGWRQNQQTFDGYTISNNLLVARTTLTYGYLYNANRPFGEDSAIGDYDMRSHIFNAAFKATSWLTTTGYGYLLDFNKSLFQPMSTKTLGLRLTGEKPVGNLKFLYTAEYADQSDYENGNPAFDNSYWFLEPGVQYSAVTAKIGYEILGGNGRFGFSTPLATLHPHQGFADVVEAGNQANGIEDLFFSLAGDLFGFKLLGIYHEFSSERGDGELGTELDLLATYGFFKYYTAGVKFANYNADEFAVDTQKFWLFLELKF